MLKTRVLNFSKNPTGISDVLLVVVIRFFHRVMPGKLQSSVWEGLATSPLLQLPSVTSALL